MRLIQVPKHMFNSVQADFWPKALGALMIWLGLGRLYAMCLLQP